MASRYVVRDATLRKPPSLHSFLRYFARNHKSLIIYYHEFEKPLLHLFHPIFSPLRFKTRTPTAPRKNNFSAFPNLETLTPILQTHHHLSNHHRFLSGPRFFHLVIRTAIPQVASNESRSCRVFFSKRSRRADRLWSSRFRESFELDRISQRVSCRSAVWMRQTGQDSSDLSSRSSTLPY